MVNASKPQVCPEIDSLVHQLTSGKGEFFDYMDDGPSQAHLVGGVGYPPVKIHRKMTENGRLQMIYLPKNDDVL